MSGLFAGCSAGPAGELPSSHSPDPRGGDAGPGDDAAVAPGPGPGPAPAVACTSDAECDDGDDCTTDLCGGIGGEFGTGMCEHGPAGRCDPVTPSPPPGDATSPVDPACAAVMSGTETTRDAYGEAVYIPFRPLEPSRLPATCNDGFEWQNCRGTIEARATPPGGAREVVLEIDIATYTAGDHLRITGVDADGSSYVLLDTCRIRTWERADPTDGRTRPPDETIRQFRTTVRPGTRSLTFDSTLTVSPWYMRVLGLCDFALGAPTSPCDRAYRPASL